MFYYTTPTTIDPYSHPLSLHDSLPISLLRRHAPEPKLNILMHDDTKRPAGPHAQGRLDIEMTRDELIPCSCTALLSRFANGADKIAFALDRKSTRLNSSH